MSGRVSAGRPHETVERALALSRTDGCVVIADERSCVHLRWAGNELTTNGFTHGRTLTVVAVAGSAQGAASGVVSRDGVTEEELEPLVRAAEAAARAAGPAEDAMPLVEGAPLAPDFTQPPARTSPAVFAGLAPALGEAFARARAGGRTLYGFARHRTVSSYLGTSAGLRLRHDQPEGTLTLNAKSPALGASSWAARATRDFTDLGPAELSELEAELAVRLSWARRRVELPAGRYETLLPPTSVADLLVYQMWSASAREAAEGRTAFSAAAGGTRVGERLSELPLSLRSDPYAPGLETAPFLLAYSSGGQAPSAGGPGSAPASVFDNGLPLSPTDWIRDGVLSRLRASRHDAALTGLPPAPAAGNLLLECAAGGRPARSLEEMMAGTERGLLLTSLWYLREVDPATLLLTGLTRDGVHVVEGGEVTGTVNNFRFNESPLGLLSRATEAGRTERTLAREWAEWFPHTAMPALRVPDFHMSSVSRGV
ncbi:metallopeptidase TldD-related protein [Streptomyces iconiensis]|uniref:Metallopeptidase TldD-related protein n=1 Tax=Streptomyces iconiensis TaxID=1384038 RepID=A0ABT7AAV2_9ACTN|nr:metallopeptidase TldD-related protein [Streptomyces iconiensis]MDJ1137743.1 metallopeptidase TldD-related protein [Streptomyces iconiensis]